MARMQLMHEYAQKSISTTLPRRLAMLSGGELNQWSMPANSGACAGVDACTPLQARPSSHPANSSSFFIAMTPEGRSADAREGIGTWACVCSVVVGHAELHVARRLRGQRQVVGRAYFHRTAVASIGLRD